MTIFPFNFSGSGDQLVPPKMMTDLFNSCGSETKLLAKFPGGTHNETWNCRHYMATIEYFFNEVRKFSYHFKRQLE